MGNMKNYKQLLEALPSKTVVFAFGRFNPPTTGHELLVKVVKKLAVQNKAEHAIYASRSQDAKKNPLPVDKKVHYLDLMFPNTRFVAANDNVRTFIEAAKELNKKYKNLIMVAGSDRVPEYEKILTKYNGTEFHFDSVKVISAGERDPDSDDASGMSGTKMRAIASKGDYKQFKRGLPSTLRDLDGKRLMNDIRIGMGLEAIKEQIKISTPNEIREQYIRGEIYLVGQFVESNGQHYEILDRGSNYLVVGDSTGNTSRKWLHDVTVVNQIQEDVQSIAAPAEISFKGYSTHNLHHSADAARAFQDTIERKGNEDPIAVLNALKATDTYMKINDYHLNKNEAPDAKDMADWRQAHAKAKESLDRIGEFMHHEDYWHMHDHEIEDMISTYKEQGKGELQDSVEIEGNMIPEELTDKTLKTNDKVKVARIIATMLGIDNAEASTSPEQLVNNALRKVRNKALNADAIKIVNQMLQLAHEVQIDYDRKLVPTKLKEATVVAVDPKKKNNIAGDIMSMSDFNKVGHSMSSGQTDTLRRQKIKHHLGEEQIDELSTDLLDRYKKKAGESASEADKKGNFTKGNKRFRGINKATFKQFANDAKLRKEEAQCPVCHQNPCACDDSHGFVSEEILAIAEEQEETTSHEQQQLDNLEDQMENELNLTDEQIDAILDTTPEDDYLEAYEPEELGVIDSDTGEEIEEEPMKEEALMEVLSRVERIRAKARFARTASKRERRVQIALKRHSDNKTINKRARRLAVSLMKKRLLRGRNAASLSVGEKERIERVIQKRKAVVGRVAMKLVSRVRKVEKDRLSHTKYTKSTPSATF